MSDLLMTLGSAVIFAALLSAVLRQAGCSGWWALPMVIPIVNFIVLGVFAFRDWPITRELARRRVADGEGGEDDSFRVLCEADALEQAGDREGAIELYQLIVDRAQSQAAAGDASRRLQQLSDRTAEHG